MKKFIAFILAVLTAVGVYSAVKNKSPQNETNDKPAICFVVEADNLFGFDFNQLYDDVYDVVAKYGYIRAVCADGHPSVYVDIDIQTPEKKYTKSKQKNINASITNEIIEMLNDVAPKSAEDDLLGAIKTGKQALSRCRDSTSKDMIVISSGISRAGVLCFQDNEYKANGRNCNSLITKKPEEVVAAIAETFSIPDLSSLDSLLWYGCGISAGKQHIPNSASVKIQDLWSYITEEAGCKADFSDISLPDKPFVTDFNSTVIDFGEDKVEIEPPKIDIKFDENQLGFVANEAVLRNEATAAELLKPYAQTIIEYSESTDSSEPILYVVGLTATFGDPKLCENLSLARSEKVKQLLVSQGCPEELIETLGLGQGGPASLRTDDTIQTDDLDALEALRAENRVVYLIGTGSEKAKLLGLSVERSTTL